ncbi:MAG: MurR/RpiR family transcriptional regulator [bacterium]|nr:MurR/RpiR family transcriptional regulator [bacterium]
MPKKKKCLKDQIEEKSGMYSRIQKKLATFLMEYWNEIPLMSIEHIAKETGVSTATISRFARIFDFKGFYDFKDDIKKEIKSIINPVDRFRQLKTDISGKKPLINVARQDVKNINKLIATTKEETFIKLVAMIENASRVFSFGASISSIFSNLIRYIFNQVQKEAHCLDEGNVTVEERIVSLKEDDLVIFCSFFPYSKSTVEYAQLAHERGLDVVAISDNAYSPISEYADLVLPIPRENVLFTTSISAFSVLINAIATEIAYNKKEKLTQSIKETDKALKRFYYLS